MTDGKARLGRGTLNRPRIREAALAALREDGPGAVTMRALAARLGADPTAVYRHYRGKDELLADLMDEMLRGLPPLDAGAPWRGQLEGWALALHRVLVTHPGSVALLAAADHTRLSTRRTEAVVALLSAQGVEPPRAATTAQALLALVTGHAAQRPVHGVDQGFWQAVIDAARPADEFPAIHASAAAWLGGDEDVLARSVALLLDGVGAPA